MEGQQSGGAVQRRPRNGQSTATFRRLALVMVLVGTLLLGVASMASASSSFYWYGENSLTCWQTGSLGSGSSTCDSVGESYLPSHMHSGGIGVDVELVNSGTSGDYCNYYNIGEGLDTTNELEQAGLTGFNPPKPFGGYQEGNHYNPADVCQAYSDTWGQGVRGNSANNKCGSPYAPCGMQHFVSLGGQGTNDRPWSSVFGSPALVISAEDNPYKVEAPNSWGYICPLLKAPSGGILEYCLEAWHVGSGSFPAYKHADEAGPCNFGGGQTFTEFAPGTKFAELVSGSSETFEYKNNGASRTFTARITPANLEAAISAVEGHGCGALSHNASEYALVGIEQGTEGGGLTTLGEATAHLETWTTYTPLPPEATTTKASEEEQTQAKLNGTVNPKGTDTHYYFQYGKTTAYGSSTSSTDAGSGLGGVAVAATITGLEAGTSYHFRVVATSAGGTVYGSDQEFKTEVTATPSVLVHSNGEGEVLYRGANAQLYYWLWNNEKWGLYWMSGAPAMAGNPTSVLTSQGYQEIFYRDTNGRLDYWWWNGEKWTLEWLGEAGAMAGEPVALVHSNGEQEIFYRGTNGQLYYWLWNGTKWALYWMSGAPAMAGNPATVLTSQGYQEIFYRDTNGRLDYWWWNGEKWTLEWLGEAGAMGGEPVTFLHSNGEQEVYYGSPTGVLNFRMWNNVEWSLQWLGSAGAL
jgi:hypothetical protein